MILLNLALLNLVSYASNTMRIPLKRVESIRERKMRQGLWSNYLTSRSRWSNRWKSGGEADVSLIKRNFDDLIYVAQIQIGTPRQNLTVLMDTGSADLWVTGTKCNNADCSHVYCKVPFLCKLFCDASCCNPVLNAENPCADKHKFSVQHSATYRRLNRNFVLKYETGSCSGTIGEDTVCIGGICVRNQVLGVADRLASFFTELPADGICGLGFASLSAMKTVPPVQRMINQNLLGKPIFTIWMQRTNYFQTLGGQLTLGGFDYDHCSAACTWVPLTKSAYWEFYIDSVTVAPTIMAPQVVVYAAHPSSRITAISDTGTYLIFGPNNVVNRLAHALQATYDRENEVYAVPCAYANVLPPVVITINGKAYPITARTYVIPTTEGTCMLGFLGRDYDPLVDSGPAWILGDCWIRQYCQVYDMRNRQIGFCSAL